MTHLNLNHKCLVKVFSYVYDLNDLINCFYVCKLWNGAVKERLNNAKYLTSFDQNDLRYIIMQPNTINLDPEAILNEYENKRNFKDPSHRFTLKYLGSHLTPNIKIVALENFIGHPLEAEIRSQRLNERLLSDFHRATSSMKQIKGSQHLGSCLLPVDCVNNLEIYKVNSSELREKDANVRDYVDFSSGKLKQLQCDWSIFSANAHHLTNLKFLFLSSPEKGQFHDHSSFPNLEILILHTNPRPFKGFVQRFEQGFNILRISPRLKSIYFVCLGDDNDPIIVPSIVCQKFSNVEDLVICSQPDVNWPWSSMKNFLEHFPNVKHFAFRWNSIIKNKHILHSNGSIDLKD